MLHHPSSIIKTAPQAGCNLKKSLIHAAYKAALKNWGAYRAQEKGK